MTRFVFVFISFDKNNKICYLIINTHILECDFFFMKVDDFLKSLAS